MLFNISQKKIGILGPSCLDTLQLLAKQVALFRVLEGKIKSPIFLDASTTDPQARREGSTGEFFMSSRRTPKLPSWPVTSWSSFVPITKNGASATADDWNLLGARVKNTTQAFVLKKEQHPLLPGNCLGLRTVEREFRRVWRKTCDPVKEKNPRDLH